MCKLRHRRSLIFTYIYSYAGITLLCCMTLWAFALWNTGIARRNMYKQALEQKMELAVADFSAQLAHMSDASMQMFVQNKFNYRLFSRNKYYEKLLLEELEGYHNYSAVAPDYFIYYSNLPELLYFYSSESSKASASLPSVYFQSRLGVTNSAAFLDSLSRNARLTITVPSDGDGDIIIFTYLIPSQSSASSYSFLCFVSSREKIAKRIALVTGGLGDNLALYCNGILLTSPANVPEGNTLLRAENDDGTIEIVIDIGKDAMYTFTLKDQGFLFFFFILSTTFFLLLSAFAAYTSYRPIRKLLSRHSPRENCMRRVNELDNIENLLIDARKSVTEAENKMLVQMETLRQKLLLLVINSIEGVNTDTLLLRDRLEGPCYCVIDIAPRDRERITVSLRGIEEFSDDRTTFYVCEWDGLGGYCVLLNMADEEALNSAVRLVSEFTGALNLNIAIGTGNICYELSEIHNSFRQAVDAARNKISDDTQYHSDRRVGERWNDILHYVEEHALDWDISLTSVANEFSMSSAALSRAFKQNFAVNFKPYIVDRKLNAAKKLFAETDLTIAEVCKRVGFSSISHFIKIFRENTGVTPSAYREKSEVKNEI